MYKEYKKYRKEGHMDTLEVDVLRMLLRDAIRDAMDEDTEENAMRVARISRQLAEAMDDGDDE